VGRSAVFWLRLNVNLEGDASEANVELDKSNGVSFECVKKCCYLGDVLNGDSMEQMIARQKYAWKKYSELGGMQTRRDIP